MGRRLAELRALRGLSQTEVAERLGLAQSAIAKLELGRRTLEPVLAVEQAELCGVPVSALGPQPPTGDREEGTAEGLPAHGSEADT